MGPGPRVEETMCGGEAELEAPAAAEAPAASFAPATPMSSPAPEDGQ
ncbi:hypothetical protein [Nannocystis pusilla]